MAKIKGNITRRREVRRMLGKPGNAWLVGLTTREAMWAGLFVVVFTMAGSAVALLGQNRFPFGEGQRVSEAIVARVQFKAVDVDKTSANKADARDREPAVYVPRQYLQQLHEKLLAMGQYGAVEKLDEIAESTRTQLQLTQASLAELKRLTAASQWDPLVDQFMQGLASVPVLDHERADIERNPQQRAPKIVINHPVFDEVERFDGELIDVQDDRNALAARVTSLASRFPATIRPSVVAMVMQAPEPFYKFDADESARRKTAAYEREQPVEMVYQANQLLVPAGRELQTIDVTLLRHEHRAYLAMLGPMKVALLRMGNVGLIAVLGLGLWSYISAYNKRIMRNPMRGFAITALLLLCQALATLTTMAWPQAVFATATFPILVVTIILAIAYDQRFALAVGSLHALIVTVSLGLPIGFTLMLLAGVAVAVSQLNEVRTRSKLVTAGLYTGLAMAVVAALSGLLTHPLHLPGQFHELLRDSGSVLLSALVTGLVVQGLLPLIEKVFKVSTAMTLKELNDASHPLLRRLAQDAPGTYQHSLRIADMSEAAADAIGANGLLCKVGAMYHDIGKMNKPLYFVENQGGGPNRHNKLSPAMSLLIIVGHVKDGIEMAREYRLPAVLRQFIESHHGTTLVEYFYHAARKKSEETDGPSPAEFEFRYPGPKPQTKEAAILMLCDGIEGAARAMSEPTPVRLEQLVHAMANKRLMDGQFDECSITLQDLHLIEVSITKTLCAIYHGRVKYPTQDAEKDDNLPEQTPARTAAS